MSFLNLVLAFLLPRKKNVMSTMISRVQLDSDPEG